MKFNIYPEFYNSSKWLEFNLSLLNAVFNNHRLSFVRQVMIPMVKLLFEDTQTPLPSEDILVTFATELFETLEVDIEIGLCAKEALAQAVPASTSALDTRLQRMSESRGHNYPRNFILLNAEWAVQSERTWEECEGKQIADENYFYGHQANLCFSFTKFLHELFHIFTPHMLKFEFDERKKHDETVKQPFNSTPTKLGLKIIPQTSTLVGDMGFFAEQFLFGNNLRVYLDYNKWDLYGCAIYFEQVNIIVQEAPPLSSPTEPLAKAPKLDEGHRRSSRSVPLPAAVEPEYSFEFYDLVSTRVGLVEDILRSIRQLLDVENDNAIMEFLLLMKIPLTSLVKSPKKKGRRGSIPISRLTRKNAPLAATCLEFLEEQSICSGDTGESEGKEEEFEGQNQNAPNKTTWGGRAKT